MRFSMQSGDLLDALKNSAVARATTFPALTHVLITADETGVELQATDMQARTRIRVDATVDRPGQALLHAAKLSAVAAGGGELSIDDEGRVRRGRSHYSVGTVPPGDFPEDPAGAEWQVLQVDGAALAAAFDAVAYRPDPNDVRTYCRGVLLRKGAVYAVASAGMVRVPMAYDGPDALIPVDQVRRLRGLLHASAQVGVANVREGLAGVVRVESGSQAAQVVCLDWRVPDCDAVLAHHALGDVAITVKRKPFEATLRRFLPFADVIAKTIPGVVLRGKDGGLVLTDKHGDAVEDVRSLALGDVADVDVAFDARVVADALAAIEGDEAQLVPGHRCLHLLPAGDRAGTQHHLSMTIKL